MNDVKFTLYLTLCLVLVIFIFLRTSPATIIPSLALPMSMVGTFSAMYLLGYTIDNLSRWRWCWRWALWWTMPS